MVNTRSQVLGENRIEQSEEGRLSEDDDNVDVADHYRMSYFDENDGETMRPLERNHERLRIEQRFSDMNRQIGELTGIVKALTEKKSNSMDGNNQDVLNSETSSRFDMVTGVLANTMPTPNTQLARRTPQSFHSPQIDDVMT